MRSRLVGVGVGVALAVVILGKVTPATAQETAEQRNACMSDAFSLCAEAIPDHARIEACLKAKRRSLSPECWREVFGDAPAVKQIRRVVPIARYRAQPLAQDQ